MSDPVRKPSHYTSGTMESIDIIREVLGEEGFVHYCRGNALKYNLRAGKKDPKKLVEDLRKAITYLRWAIGEEPRNDK